MFIDASALVSILFGEADGGRLSDAVEAADIRLTSPIAIYETVAALMSKKAFSRLAAEERLRAVLTASRIEVIPITDEIGRAALDAFERYGKGRGHPAQLNMGDCFAYAAARVMAVPLLYKGDDFSLTELA